MISIPPDSSFYKIAFPFLPHLLVLPSPIYAFVTHSNLTRDVALAQYLSTFSFFRLHFPSPFSFSNPSLSTSESSCQSSHSAPRFLRLCDWFKTLQLPLMWLLLIKPHFPPLKRSPKHKPGPDEGWEERANKREQMRWESKDGRRKNSSANGSRAVPISLSLLHLCDCKNAFEKERDVRVWDVP